MTSNEALEALFNISPIKEIEGSTDCVREIKRDLKVLEILKKHLKVETDYCGNSEFATHTTISLNWDNEELPVDSKEGKEHKLVKEWLTNDK